MKQAKHFYELHCGGCGEVPYKVKCYGETLQGQDLYEGDFLVSSTIKNRREPLSMWQCPLCDSKWVSLTPVDDKRVIFAKVEGAVIH